MLYWLPILPYCVSIGATFSAAPNTNLTVRTPNAMDYSKSNFPKQTAICNGVFAQLGGYCNLLCLAFFSILMGFCGKRKAKMLPVGTVPPLACACFAHAYSWPSIVYINVTSCPDNRSAVFML